MQGSWLLNLVLPITLATPLGCDSSSTDDQPTSSLDAATSDAATSDAETSDGATGEAGAEDSATADTGIGDVSYALPPPFEPSGFPKDDAGRPILVQGASARLVLERLKAPATADVVAGPVNKLAGCQRQLLACMEAVGKGGLDYCMAIATCKGTTPECCPTACGDAYTNLRVKGVKDVDAAYRVFFTSPRCIPGLDDALGGGK